MKVTGKHVFFWGDIPSNFYEISGGIKLYPLDNFEEFETNYVVPTSEHVFMYIKAMTFGDVESAKAILKAPTPKEAKKLGRKIKGFDEGVWGRVRESAMYTAVMMKFYACPEFRELVTKYKGRCFVEASPYDTIWGIGAHENDPNIDDESTWRGLNLLGKAINKLQKLV